MRILQIIDSLEAGGAERMAVSYANALVDKIDFSGIVVTRKEGVLSTILNKKVNYFFINKKKSIDVKALFKLKRIVFENQITHIHAHSSSFFTAFLLKIIYPNVSLIWHDHYGNSEFLEKRSKIGLRIMIPFFYGVISVNTKLKTWADKNKLSNNIIYLPNFPSKGKEVTEHTILKGSNRKRILCLANLRFQKNHFLLLEVASKIKKSKPDWTFHLVGKDFHDNYSKQIKKKIVQLKLENHVFIYGSKQDVGTILEQSDIAILTSLSEGLPVSLLEYGMHKKPVVVTDVGEIPLLVHHTINGFVVSSNDTNSFYEALVKLIGSPKLKISFGEALYQEIINNYSELGTINKYLIWLQSSRK
jgi:glycosyltransferase involved in cell wall biosynthesis